jgi:hypothetical protein
MMHCHFGVCGQLLNIACYETAFGDCYLLSMYFMLVRVLFADDYM